MSAAVRNSVAKCASQRPASCPVGLGNPRSSRSRTLRHVNRAHLSHGGVQRRTLSRGVQICAALPSPTRDIIDPSGEATMLDLQERFRMADIDGNGRIDKPELRKMLESVEGGRAYPLLLEEGWLPEDRVDAAMAKYDIDNSGDIDFDEFKQMVYDGLFLEGTIQEYEEAFAAVDKSGNGSIGATELAQLFKNLGRPLGIDRIAEIFMKYDKDESGQIEFGEFMLMFRDQLLDLNQIKSWNNGTGLGSSGAAGSVLETESGAVSVVFTAEEVEEVLAKHKDQLVVLFCGLTWCRPCKGVAKAYERMAEQYSSAVFLKLYGNANPACKGLFKQFKIRSTPSFLYFKNGEVVGSNTGANKEKLETNLRSHLSAAELEGKERLYVAQPETVAA